MRPVYLAKRTKTGPSWNGLFVQKVPNVRVWCPTSFGPEQVEFPFPIDQRISCSHCSKRTHRIPG